MGSENAKRKEEPALLHDASTALIQGGLVVQTAI
jgi:hypothetical protein